MIYFLVDPSDHDPLVKIGFAKSPERVVDRLQEHRGSNIRWYFYCAIDGDMILEKRLHDQFAAHRAATDNREIFHLTPELGDYLEWLGEQPWAACSLAEVVDPWAHWTTETMWPWQEYRASTTPPHRLSLFTPMYGNLRGPLSASERGSSFSRDSNDWYTPLQYIAAARRVMGTIDLDPATSQLANRSIRAAHIYTKNDDGLAPSNPWSGNVWLNPPYGGQQIDFITRLIREHENGNVPQAVLCINGYRYDARWFQPLWRYTLAFAARRVRFLGGACDSGAKSEDDNNPSNGTVFVYFGPNRTGFATEFSRYCNVALSIVRYTDDVIALDELEVVA